MSKILYNNLCNKLYDNITYVIISGDIELLNKILNSYNTECKFKESDYNKYIIVVDNTIFMFIYVTRKFFQQEPAEIYLSTIKSRNISHIHIDDPNRKGSFQRTNLWVSNMISNCFTPLDI